MSTSSLRKRLLVAATITLIAFLGLAGIALDRAFTTSAKVSVKNQLKTQVNALLTVIELDEAGELIVPAQLPESRLSSPNSGLYAMILDQDGNILWRSKSSVGIDLGYRSVNSPGTEIFFQVGDQVENPFYYSFGIAWEVGLNQEKLFTLAMINESHHYRQFIYSHRKELIFWLGLAGILLLVMQSIALRWGLTPLGKVTQELDLIERAQQEKILGRYPQEIAQLSQRINLFIENERKNLTRYRNTLGDLAHSLKTPLAVIKGITEKQQDMDTESINEHINRMNSIVEYQLKRAASSQFSIMHSVINVQDVMKKIDDSLHKVYADKSLTSVWDMEDNALFYGDESDLYELLGNIIDNAFKWAKNEVTYRARILKKQDEIHNGIVIDIEDDGPGIAVSEREAVFRRGARVEQHLPGQGIGLAVSREIIERYNGKLEIRDSESSGTLIRIQFPVV